MHRTFSRVLRRLPGGALLAAAAQSRLIETDYAYHPTRRPIETTVFGRRLEAALEAGRDGIAATLRGFASHAPALAGIPRDATAPEAPFWANDWFPALDAVSLYGLIAAHAPRRYIEVGSGNSTRFARRAIRDLGLATRIVSIDPAPRAEIDALCDATIRAPLEHVPATFWSGLERGDMLFVDNSHRSFPGSDVTVFFTEILPGLPSGLLWGLHDICLPWDYPVEWGRRFYNEQYLLAAYLAGGGGGDAIVLPAMWAAYQPELHGILEPLWSRTDLFAGVPTHGCGFWMERGEGGGAGLGPLSAGEAQSKAINASVGGEVR